MTQKPLIKALLKAKAFPHPVKKIKLLETYISWLLFTGCYVYKIKKPVYFGYLDFRTLKKRKYFCKQEVKLNRRLAPKMYLGVVPVVRDQSTIKIGAKGKIIDWAVKMIEWPQQKLMSRLLRRGRVKRSHLNQIVKILVKFHQRAESSRKIKSYGSLKIIKKNWQENFAQTKNFIPRLISRDKYNFIRKKIYHFLEKKVSLFEQRIQENKIKDCHGDLHSDNIFIIKRDIYIYDCLEFNERFRYGDTARDTAFLTMDLDFLGKKKISSYLIKKYIEASRDKSLIKIINFYRLYYAFVRGKVEGFSWCDRKISLTSRKKSLVKAKKYFNLAHRYAKNLV